MGLTAENEQRLSDAGLVEFLERHRELFAAMAAEAYRYAPATSGRPGCRFASTMSRCPSNWR